jgi:hypothetical protein
MKDRFYGGCMRKIKIAFFFTLQLVFYVAGKKKALFPKER